MRPGDHNCRSKMCLNQLIFRCFSILGHFWLPVTWEKLANAWQTIQYSWSVFDSLSIWDLYIWHEYWTYFKIKHFPIQDFDCGGLLEPPTKSGFQCHLWVINDWNPFRQNVNKTDYNEGIFLTSQPHLMCYTPYHQLKNNHWHAHQWRHARLGI